MLLALATCSKLPPHEVDDRALHAALRGRGLAFEQPVWSDDAVDWQRYDAVLIRTTWDYPERLAEYLDWAVRVAAVTRLWNPPAVVRWNTHKRYLRELGGAGVPVVPTVFLPRGSRVDVGQRVDRLGWPAAVLKPCVGATARETLRFAADAAGVAAAQSHVDRLIGGEDLMLQPFLASVTELGEGSAIVIDGALSHCVQKLPARGDYRSQDEFGGSDRPLAPGQDERALIDGALAVTRRLHGEPLYARVDWLRDDDGAARLSELELVEPSLFFRHGPQAAGRLVDAWLRRL